MNKKSINLSYLASLAVSVLIAFLIGAVILLISGFSPIKAYAAILSGAFGNIRHVGDFLEYGMVLCLCALACVLGSRVGIFNVGGEGQLLLGAIAACQVGIVLEGMSRIVVLPLAALAAIAVGAAYALIPGILKVKLKVNEVITTIMMNTIAASFCQFLAKGPWKNSNKNIVAGTEKLGAEYWFSGLIPRSNLTTAILAAAIIAFMLWYVMEKTSVGFEMKMTGQNERFAFFSGFSTEKIVILSMAVSGAICGIVGMFRIYGAEHIYTSSVSNDYYFEGMMVAMISGYQVVPSILLALFFAILKIGAQGMELSAGVPNQIYLIIQTIIIFCMAAESGITASIKARAGRKKAKEAAQMRQKGGRSNG